jgi:hypothetical protein
VDGKLWRNTALEVRTTYGRGGKSGLIYEVSLRSLSEALQEPLERTCDDRPTPVAPQALIDRAIVASTFQGRSELVKTAAHATGKSVRTVQRTLAKVKAGGAVAATRKKPVNAGRPRVAISRAFAGFAVAAGWTPDAAWSAHEALKDHVRALWVSQAANAGWRVIAGRARKKLAADLAPDLAAALTPAQRRQVFDVPRRFVESERIYSLVNRKRTDAKRTYDERPGTLLDLNACGPMEMV